MKIHEHLAVEKLSAAGWGRLMGLSRAQAARAVRGKAVPSRRVVIRTYVWSGGKVRPDDWYDLPDLSTLPAAEAA
jgi:hypothetical protein